MIGDMPWWVWVYGGAVAMTGALLLYGLAILVATVISTIMGLIFGEDNSE